VFSSDLLRAWASHVLTELSESDNLVTIWAQALDDVVHVTAEARILIFASSPPWLLLSLRQVKLVQGPVIQEFFKLGYIQLVFSFQGILREHVLCLALELDRAQECLELLVGHLLVFVEVEQLYEDGCDNFWLSPPLDIFTVLSDERLFVGIVHSGCS